MEKLCGYRCYPRLQCASSSIQAARDYTNQALHLYRAFVSQNCGADLGVQIYASLFLEQIAGTIRGENP